MDVPVRKQNRLTEYDYSTPGAYFITICTENRKNLFWDNVGASIARPQDIQLSNCGEIVAQSIQEVSKQYSMISVDQYVVMPNHVHILLRVSPGEDGQPVATPTVSRVVQQMKGIVTKRVGCPIWQKGFYDHVVRGYEDYREIWRYIEGNPMKWEEDKLRSSV